MVSIGRFALSAFLFFAIVNILGIFDMLSHILHIYLLY